MRIMTAVFMSALLFSSSLIWAEPAPVLTLSEFSGRVLAYYPKIKASRSQVDMALAQKMKAYAGFWPSVTLSAGYTQSDDPVQVFGMLLKEERFSSDDFQIARLNDPRRHQDLSGGIHVSLPLFDSMQTIYRASAARAGLKAAQAEEEFTRMEALLLAADAYLGAVTLEKLSAAVKEASERSQEDLRQASDLKDKGMILGADYYAARVMAADFTRMNNELERQKTAMRALINILMGEAPQKEWSLSLDLKTLEGSVPDGDQLMSYALDRRPDVQALFSRQESFKNGLSAEKATGLPSVSAFASVTNDRARFSESGGTNSTAGVKAELPLFDPAQKGRVREASARLDRLSAELALLKDSIRRDLVQEISRNQAIRDNVSVMKAMADDSAEVVALIVPLYNEGRKSIADVMEARKARLQALQAYHQSLMAGWLSEARLLFIAGRLDESAFNELNQRSGL